MTSIQGKICQLARQTTNIPVVKKSWDIRADMVQFTDNLHDKDYPDLKWEAEYLLFLFMFFDESAGEREE